MVTSPTFLRIKEQEASSKMHVSVREDGGSMLLGKVDELVQDYMKSHTI